MVNIVLILFKSIEDGNFIFIFSKENLNCVFYFLNEEDIFL